MSKTIDFLKETGVFFLSTVNKNSPATRPFGAVSEFDNKLLIATNPNKEVYKQLVSNNNVQITALRAGTRDWIRIDGIATETFDLAIKQFMYDDCLNLHKHYTGAKDDNFRVFIVELKSINLAENGIKTKLL